MQVYPVFDRQLNRFFKIIVFFFIHFEFMGCRRHLYSGWGDVLGRSRGHSLRHFVKKLFRTSISFYKHIPKQSFPLFNITHVYKPIVKRSTYFIPQQGCRCFSILGRGHIIVMSKCFTYTTNSRNDQQTIGLKNFDEDAVILFRQDTDAVEIYFCLKKLYNEFIDMIFFQLWGDNRS